MHRRGFLLILVCFLALASGCGGGGGGGGETVLPRVTLHWAARSGAGRATNAPASALSATIRLVGAASDGTDVVILAHRRAELPTYTDSYTATTPARLGTYPLRVVFFALDNASGDIVATAEGTATLTADGQLPDLTTVGRVASVAVVAGQQLMLGERKALSYTAHAKDGSVLAVTKGSGFWSVASGSAITIQDDAPFGQSPGVARVRLQVDGIVSPEVEVGVVSGTRVGVTPSTVELTLGGTQQLTAQVTGTSNTAVTWSVREGGSGGAVSSDGLYTAPAVPGIYHVVATSVYDPAHSGEAEVQIVSGGLTVGGSWGDSGGLGVGIQ